MNSIINKIEEIENAIYEARRELSYAEGNLEEIKTMLKRKTLTPEAFIYKDRYFTDKKYIASSYIIELIENVNLNNLDPKLQTCKELDIFANDYVNDELFSISKEDLLKHGLVNDDFLQYFDYKYKNLDFYISRGTHKIIIKQKGEFIGLIMGMRTQIETFFNKK